MKTFLLSILLVCFLILSGSLCVLYAGGQLKAGWTQELLSMAIKGCTYGMFNPQVEAYKERASMNGRQVSNEEMENLKKLLFPKFEKTCRCLLEKVAQKWSYEAFQKGQFEVQQYTQDLIENGECQLPQPPS